MNNVESKVLEMKFDNEQFESAVATTMSTLDKFKEKLQFKGDSKGLENLGKATSNYQYTLQDIGESISNLEKRFSAIGTVGARVLERLTDSAYNFVKSGISNFISDIVQGGQSRAMNLEQAQFQLRGILGSAEEVHRVIYGDILPQLQGTPFSLDQAAVVMGQLAASGKTTSAQIQRATRGIAGLAAMTNHSFADVGRIFTKVAGSGVMMAEELNQLSGYGVNAASDLSKFFKMVQKDSSLATPAVISDMQKIEEAFGEFNEANIREAASKRMLSYGSMAAAMDVLYGEHAQKSTQMFSGALEDLKAALARVGAEPATLRLNFLRDAFNALVPAVDAVNAVIKPFWNASRTTDKAFKDVEEYVKPFTGPLAQKVQELGWSFQKLFVKLDKNNEIIRVTKKNYKELGMVFDKTANVFRHKKTGLEYDEKQALMNPKMLKTITRLTKSFVNIVTALGKIAGRVGKTMENVFPKVTLKNVASIAKHIESFTKMLIPSELTLTRIGTVARAVFTPMDVLVRGAVAGFKIFVSILKASSGVFETVSEAIWRVVLGFSRMVINLGLAVGHFGRGIVNIAKFGVEVIKLVAQFLHLNKVIDVVKGTFTNFSSFIGGIFEKIGINANNLGRRFENWTEKLDITKLQTKIQKVSETLGGLTMKIADFVKEALHIDEIRKGFEEFWKPLKEFLDSHNIFETIWNGIKEVVKWLGQLVGFSGNIDTMAASLDNLQVSIGGFTSKPIGKIRKWLGDFGKSIVEFLGNLDKAGYVSDWFKGNVKAYRFLLTIGKYITRFIEPLGGSVIEFIKSFSGIKSTGELVKKAASWIKGGFETIAKAVGLFLSKDNGAKLHSAMTNLFNEEFATKAAKAGKGFKLAVKPLSDALTTLGDTISSKLSAIDPQTVKKFLVTLVLLTISISYLETLRNARKTIKGFLMILDKLADIPRAIASVARGFENCLAAFKGIAKAITGVAYILSVAAALVIFAAAVKILSTIDTTSMLVATAVLGAAIVGIIGLMVIFNKMDLNNDGNRVLKLSGSILGVAGSMLLLSLAIKTLVDVADASSWKDVAFAVGMIAILMTAIAVMGKILSGTNVTKDVQTLGWAAVGLGQGMKMMAEACKAMATEMSEEELDRAVNAVLKIMFFMALFSAANWQKDAHVGKAAFGMIGMAVSLMLIAKAMKDIGKNLTDAEAERAINALNQIMIFFSLFTLAIGGAAKLGAGTATAIGVILSAGIFFKLLAESMNSMSGLVDNGNLDKIAETIQSFLAIMAVISLISAFGGADAAAGPLAIAALSVALAGLAVSIYALSQLSFMEIANGFSALGLAMGALLGGLILFNLAIKQTIDPKSALGMLAIAAGVMMFAVAIGMLADMPLQSLAVAMLGFIGILVAVGLVLSSFTALSPAMLLIGAAFALVGVAALFVGAGLMLVTLALSALIPLIVALGGTDVQKLSDGINILKMTAEGLKEVFYAIADGVLYFGTAVVVTGVGLLIFAVGLLAVDAAVIIASLGILMLAGSFAVLASVLDAFVPQIKDSVLGTLGTLIGKVGEFFGSLREESGRIVKETEAMKNEAADNAGEAPKKASEAFAEGKDELFNMNTGMWDMVKSSDAPAEAGGEQGTNLLETLSSTITSEGPGVMNGAFDGIVNEESFASMYSSVEAGGIEVPSIFGDSIAANAGAAESGVTTMTQTAAEAAGSPDAIASFGDAATSSADTYGQTLTDSQAPAAGGTAMAHNASSAAANNTSGASSAGNSLAQGFAGGINSGTWSWVVPAARSMAQAAIDTAKSELDVNSPSKVFIKIGHSVGEGFVMGIDAMTSNVGKSSEELMSSSVGAAKLAVAAMNAATEIEDFNPTITPVVDLTNVDQSVDKMNTMFGSTFGVNSPFNSVAFAASAFNDSRNQNARSSDIARLANKIDSMTESMNSRSLNNYITIDGATDPDAFADGLIRSFRLKARTV